MGDVYKRQLDNKTSMRKGFKMRDYSLFIFFKFINLKFSIMNKKFLSVSLFSALMVGTAGTFTSCKDYDDDIKDLQGQLDKRCV